MPAYLIYVCHGVNDRLQLKEYWRSHRRHSKGGGCKCTRRTRHFAFSKAQMRKIQGTVIAAWPSFFERIRRLGLTVPATSLRGSHGGGEHFI